MVVAGQERENTGGWRCWFKSGAGNHLNLLFRAAEVNCVIGVSDALFAKQRFVAMDKPSINDIPKCGRMVNRVSGELSEQRHERHDASDFDLQMQHRIRIH